MTDLATWKIVSDAGLGLALVLLCLRFSRRGTPKIDTGRIRALEGSLRTMIREAEAASKELSKELAVKQRSLEQLLFDLQSAESRANHAVNAAEDLKRELEALRSSRHAEGGRREIDPVEFPAVHSTSDLAEPPSFDASPPPRAARTTVARDDVPRNIYGEPILREPAEPVPPPREQDAPARSRAPFRSLASKIEREVRTPNPASGTADVQRTLEDVYGAAERMLREGGSLAAVAAETQLPVEEVEMLSQIVAQETRSNGQIVSDSDERLGVLGGGIRRSRQVL